MKLKLDEHGHAVIENGQPVYVHDDGTAKPFDAVATLTTIKRLNSEAKGHRERAESAEGRAALFEGLDDPAAARDALETVKSLDAKGRAAIDQVRTEVTKAMQARIDAAETKAKGIEAQFHDELIGGGFARSKFVGEKLAIPHDVARAFFGKHFAIKDGKVSATDAQGVPILSRADGSPAGFDDALETLVASYPNRDSIMRATQKSGSGAPAGGGGNPANKTMTRAQFETSGAEARMAFAKDGGTLTD